MGRQSDPKGPIQASIPNAVQAGAPHTASIDRDLSTKTIRLWYESQRKAHVWEYWYADDMPFVSATSVNTAYAFKMTTPSSTDNHVWPWVMGPSVDTIRVFAAVAKPSSIPASALLLECYTGTIIDAVTPASGPAVPMHASHPMSVNRFSPAGSRHPWVNQFDSSIDYAAGTCWVFDPDLASSGGLIGLGLKLTWNTDGDYSPAEDFSPTFKLLKAEAYNYKRSPL